MIRVSALSTNDRANVLLSDGTNYVAIQIKVASNASQVAGTQNGGFYSYRIHNCSVNGNAISPASGPDLSVDGADIETTGRMWVDVTSPGRGLQTVWAFQVAIPLGVAWAPSALTLPVSGAFKLWYEVWTSVPHATVPYQSPPPPLPLLPVQTSGALQIIPMGLEVGHLLDMGTGGACTDAVTISYSGVGVRNVPNNPPFPPRSDQYTIKLDLGQTYPPNMANPTENPAHISQLYNESQTPTVAALYQNQFFAQPNVTGLADPTVVRVRFSLANWGSQLSDPTANSWRPVPGGEDVQYQTAVSEARFVWPQVADSYTTTLVRNINTYLNHVWNHSLPSAPNAQNPHQCMLAELSSTDPSVVFTRSSIYVNMNVASASVLREPALISIEGLKPISAGPRDVYLYLQTFNMPKVAKGEDPTVVQRNFDARMNLTATHEEKQGYEVEDIAAFFPTYIVHAYHDAGEMYQLEDGRRVPILRPQTAFGYFVQHQGPLYGWETRIYGAEKLAENFYRLRVANHGAQYVEPAIQARESAAEPPLPDDGLTGCKALVAGLETKGLVGKFLACLLRPLCNLFGDYWWILLLVILVIAVLLL